MPDRAHSSEEESSSDANGSSDASPARSEPKVRMAGEVDKEDSPRRVVTPSNTFVRVQSSLWQPHPDDVTWRMRLRKLLNTTTVDILTGFVILFDISMNWIDIDARAAGQTTPLWTEVASSVCLFMYLIELVSIVIVDLEHWKTKLLMDFGFVMDVVIVTSGLAQLVLSTVGIDAAEVTLLRILRVVRILRLFRLFRKFRMLKELRKLVRMTGLCFKTLIWSFIFCFVVMTSWAMLMVELLYPTMTSLIEKEGEWEDCESCRASLSSVINAVLLIFKTVVAGDRWGDVAVPLISEEPWLASSIFVGSHLTIVFGVLNLVVAVVVDTFAEQRLKDVATMAMEMDEEAEDDLRELDRIFLKIDQDMDGTLTLDELVDGARRVREFQNRLRVMDIDQQDLQQLFNMLDRDGGGTIDPDEFKKTLSRWAFESKTATRFVRYNLQQLMSEHNAAAKQIEKMESRLSEAMSTQSQSSYQRPRPIRRRRRRQETGGDSKPKKGHPVRRSGAKQQAVIPV